MTNNLKVKQGGGRSLSTKELHSVLYGIADEFARVCAANGIPYYMLGGTLLGAVRHGEIIPWDDDMDFGVPRQHFGRLQAALRKQLHAPYAYYGFGESEYIDTPAFKIADTRTIIIEQGRDERLEPIGVNIDVFPLDTTNGCHSLFSRNGLIQALLHIDQFRARKEFDSKGKRAIGAVVKCLFWMLDSSYFIRRAEKLAPKGSGSYITNHYGLYRLREIVPAEYIGQPMPYALGGHTYTGVADADAYLTAIYGDYMQLPPEDKRHTHIINVWWKEDAL